MGRHSHDFCTILTPWGMTHEPSPSFRLPNLQEELAKMTFAKKRRQVKNLNQKILDQW